MTTSTTFTPTMTWLFAGNATLVVESADSTWPGVVRDRIDGPKSMAFSLSQSEDGGKFFVWTRNVLDSDSTRGRFLGFLDAVQIENALGRLRLKISRATDISHEGNHERRVFEWALEHIRLGREMAAGFTLGHAGRCGRCGRELTDPQSIASGIGPTCATKE